MTKFIEHRNGHRELSKDIIIFYHANCTDGFTAAWAAWKKFGDTAEYVATFHEDPPPEDIRGKEIYTLDLTFPEPVTRNLIENNLRVTAIDHHISSKAITEMTKDFLFSNDHSGAVLAWQYFHPAQAIPKMLLNVEDMDLWRFNLAGTKELYSYFDLYDFDFEVWSKLADDYEDDAKRLKMLETGALLLKNEQKVIERLVSKDAYLVELDGRKLYAINASSNFRSYMGNILAKKSPSGIGLVWWETGDGWIAASLRSFGDVDVSAVASKYNGGGHKNAAAFRLSSVKEIPWTRI